VVVKAAAVLVTPATHKTAAMLQHGVQVAVAVAAVATQLTAAQAVKAVVVRF
jgi:hypothetical protein